jgi:NADPH:quinone reductase
LLLPFLQKIGSEATQKLRERVATGVKTIFASSYTKTVSLAEALQLDAISVYGNPATGEKYLINPNKEMVASTVGGWVVLLPQRLRGHARSRGRSGGPM